MKAFALREIVEKSPLPPPQVAVIILFNHMQGIRWEITEDCRESSQAVTANSSGKKHVTYLKSQVLHS